MAQQQARNAYKYMLQAGVTSTLSIITLSIYTRILIPSDFGYLALAHAYAAIVVSIASFGLHEAVERNYFEYKAEHEKQGALLISAIFFTVIVSGILLIITYIFLHFFSNLMKMQGAEDLILWGVVAHILISANNFAFIYLKNNSEASRFAVYSILVSIVNASVGVYFVIYMKIGPVGIFYGYFISGIFGSGLLMFYFFKMYKLSLSYDVFVHAFKISYPLTPRILVNVFNNHIDKYLISVMSTIANVGVYSVSQRIAYMVFYFMTLLQNVFAPEVYKKLFSGDDMSIDIGSYLSIFLYVSTLVALVIVLFSYELVFYLLGDLYENTADVISVLAVFYAIQFPSMVTYKQLLYTKKSYIISMLSLMFLVISLLLIMPLVKYYGAMGAAWGVLIAGIFSNLVIFFIAQHYNKLEWKVNTMLMIYVILVLGLLLAVNLDYQSGLTASIILIKFSVLICYIIYGLVINVITLKNLRVLRDAILIRNKTHAL